MANIFGASTSPRDIAAALTSCSTRRARRSLEAEDAAAADAAGKTLYEVLVALKERER